RQSADTGRTCDFADHRHLLAAAISTWYRQNRASSCAFSSRVPAPVMASLSNRLQPAAACIAAVALLCLPAIWNGFLLVFDDVGGYLERWPTRSLGLGRSAVYGLLLLIPAPVGPGDRASGGRERLDRRSRAKSFWPAPLPVDRRMGGSDRCHQRPRLFRLGGDPGRLGRSR